MVTKRWDRSLAAFAADEAVPAREGARHRPRSPSATPTTSGTALYFTLMAVRSGCVAISFDQRESLRWAPWGGRGKGRGNETPWSWAASRRDATRRWLLDIAKHTGVVAARQRSTWPSRRASRSRRAGAIDAAGSADHGPPRQRSMASFLPDGPAQGLCHPAVMMGHTLRRAQRQRVRSRPCARPLFRPSTRSGAGQFMNRP